MDQHANISRHAFQRTQQRGVPLALLENILDYHDHDSEVGDDCRVLRVSRKAALAFAAQGGDRQVADRLPGIAVVWSDKTNRVVTVIHDTGNRAARRYRGVN